MCWISPAFSRTHHPTPFFTRRSLRSDLVQQLGLAADHGIDEGLNERSQVHSTSKHFEQSRRSQKHLRLRKLQEPSHQSLFGRLNQVRIGFSLGRINQPVKGRVLHIAKHPCWIIKLAVVQIGKGGNRLGINIGATGDQN